MAVNVRSLRAAYIAALILLCYFILSFYFSPHGIHIPHVGGSFQKISTNFKTNPLSSPGSYTPRMLFHKSQIQKAQSTFHNHGATTCLPTLSYSDISQALAMNDSCTTYAPFKRSNSSSRIARVMAHYGSTMEDYEQKAMKTHMKNCIIHGMDLHMLCDAMVDSYWNKQAFLLRLMLEQLSLKEEARYEWLLWMDGDTVLLDQCRPPADYLPPGDHGKADSKGSFSRRDATSENILDNDHDDMKGALDAILHSTSQKKKDIHLVAATDHNGLNAGIFFLRVHPWSISFLLAVLSFPTYKPEVKLLFAEQTAMQELMQTSPFTYNVVYTPWEFFNVYPLGPEGGKKYAESANNDTKSLGGDVWARRGDWVVHFAGHRDKVRRRNVMEMWLKAVEKVGNVWDGKLQRDMSEAISSFWKGKGFTWSGKT